MASISQSAWPSFSPVETFSRRWAPNFSLLPSQVRYLSCRLAGCLCWRRGQPLERRSQLYRPSAWCRCLGASRSASEALPSKRRAAGPLSGRAPDSRCSSGLSSTNGACTRNFSAKFYSRCTGTAMAGGIWSGSAFVWSLSAWRSIC